MNIPKKIIGPFFQFGFLSVKKKREMSKKKLNIPNTSIPKYKYGKNKKSTTTSK